MLHLNDSQCRVTLQSFKRSPPVQRSLQPPRIIGLCGAIGAGKSTVAKLLVSKHGRTLLPLAGPLKNMLMSLGLSYAQVYGSEKEVPSDLLCGKTPRHAMQTLGTEWGRNHVGQELWTKAWLAQLAQLPNDFIVVDDVRFANEFAMIRDLGGVIVDVWRDSLPHTNPSHPSERDRLAIAPDFIILNGGTEDALWHEVALMLKSTSKVIQSAAE
jgi:hypothetical protein